jgi:hypothetical protein
MWRSFYVFVRKEKKIKNFENPISGIDQSARDIGSVKVRRRPRDTVFKKSFRLKKKVFLVFLFFDRWSFLESRSEIVSKCRVASKRKKRE